MSKPRKFNFKGYRVYFPVGIDQNVVGFTVTQDDGTWGNYLVVEFDGVPYATIPIVDKEGLGKMIEVLQDIYKNAFK